MSPAQHGMIEVPRGVGQAGTDVFGLKIRVVLKDLLLRGALRHHVEYVLYADAHATNAGPPTALIRVNSDSFHGQEISLSVCSLHLPLSPIRASPRELFEA